MPEKGVSNGDRPLKFSSARKIWPLIDLLAKFRLACSEGVFLASER